MASVSNNQVVVEAAGPESEISSDVLLSHFRRNMGQISRQSLVFFLGTLFTMAAGYLVKVYVARILGAELLGLYALGMTLVSFSQLLGVIGLPATAARYVAVYNATGRFGDLRSFLRKSASLLAGLNLLFSLALLFSGAWFARAVYHAPRLAQYIPYFAVLALLGALSAFFSQVLAGFKDVAKRTVITNFIGSSLNILLIVIFLAAGTRMRGYLAAQILGTIVVVTLLITAVWRLMPHGARAFAGTTKALDPEIKGFALAAFGMNALDFLLTQADKILLGVFLNASVVGIYVLASTLANFIPIVLQSVNQIFAPVIADLHAQSHKDVLERLFQTLTKWIIGLTFPLACVLVVFASPLMRIFGPEFVIGWKVLLIAAIGQLVNCGVGSVGYLLLMSGNQRRLIRVQFSMAVTSVVVNLALIPALGIVGAAIAAALINIIGNLWNLREVRKALRIWPYNRSYYFLLAPAFCTLAVVLLLRSWPLLLLHPWAGVFLAIGTAYAVFCAGALLFALDSDDRVIAQRAWAQISGSLQRLGARA